MVFRLAQVVSKGRLLLRLVSDVILKQLQHRSNVVINQFYAPEDVILLRKGGNQSHHGCAKSKWLARSKLALSSSVQNFCWLMIIGAYT